MLQAAFRPSCMNRASVFEWHRRFNEGRESVRDDEGCGRSIEVNTPELMGQRRRILRRGVEFHVCTINKSAHTKKVWKLIVCSSYIYICYKHKYINVCTCVCTINISIIHMRYKSKHVCVCVCVLQTGIYVCVIHISIYVSVYAIPGGNTPQGTNYTATCLPSRKLSKLDEPDMEDTAGEAGTSS